MISTHARPHHKRRQRPSPRRKDLRNHFLRVGDSLAHGRENGLVLADEGCGVLAGMAGKRIWKDRALRKHLFGAVDLYEVTPDMKKIDEKMEEMYPKEVMHRSHYPMKELMISPLTAWLVGLTDKQEDWFKTFL